MGSNPTLSAKCSKSLFFKDLKQKRLQECILICVSILKPFLFSRGQKNYARFFIPVRFQSKIGKKFLVFALGSGAGHELRLKAHQIEHYLSTQLLQNDAMSFDPSQFNFLDVVLRDGTQLKNINNDDDVRRAKELLKALGMSASSRTFAPVQQPALAPLPAPEPAPAVQVKGLKMIELVDKFFLLKSHLKPATVQAYKNTALEFQKFLKNPNITSILISDVTRFQEHLATNKNSTRTIDNKIATLRALFNFAIKQGYYFEKNPAENRSLLTKKQRIAGGYEKFNLDEIELIFTSEEFKKEKKRDPDFYYLCSLALVTGCRVGELASLHINDFKSTRQNTTYIKIKDAKTLAGVRSVPFPQWQINGFNSFLADKKENVFKYVEREGKGSGNAVGKKFTRLLETLKIKREKLVFHSLRKFLNDYLLKNNVQYEPRCQFVGHEIDDTNVAIYSREYTEDELKSYIFEHQVELISRTKLDI